MSSLMIRFGPDSIAAIVICSMASEHWSLAQRSPLRSDQSSLWAGAVRGGAEDEDPEEKKHAHRLSVWCVCRPPPCWQAHNTERDPD